MGNLMPQPRSSATAGEQVVRTLDELIARCPFDPAAVETGCTRVEQLARRHLLRAFQDEGVFLANGEQHGVAELQKRLRVAPKWQ